MDKKTHRFETKSIHAGQEPDPHTGAIMTPIYQTSTYVQSAPEQHSGYEYSRTDNPTRTAFQKQIAALENGDFALAFASGMATIDTVLRLFAPGDHIIVGNDVYGGTYRLFEEVYRQYGMEFSYLDLTDVSAVRNALRTETKLVWLESPTNPYLTITDIQQIRQQTPSKVLVAVDNTFASPYLQQPLILGADLVVHSTTKYLGGHSDVVGGAVVMNDVEIYDRVKFLQNAVGAVPGPQDVWLTMRGIKTLHVRMDRHCENAMAVARFLEDQAQVQQVIYPGLESHPQHELARLQMRDFGGMVSVIMTGGEAAARAFVRNTRLFQLAESLGGIESLIEHPYSMTHASTVDSEISVDPGLVRLSVGIEHIEDLLDDLASALNAVKHAKGK